MDATKVVNSLSVIKNRIKKFEELQFKQKGLEVDVSFELGARVTEIERSLNKIDYISPESSKPDLVRIARGLFYIEFIKEKDIIDALTISQAPSKKRKVNYEEKNEEDLRSIREEIVESWRTLEIETRELRHLFSIAYSSYWYIAVGYYRSKK